MHGTRRPASVALRGEGQAPHEWDEGWVDSDARPRWRSRLSDLALRLLREPLTHFLLLGLLIFALARYFDEQSRRYVIEIGPKEQQRIAESYAQQYGELPSAGQLKAMTEDYIRKEVLLREGLALGLDKDDEIVRRRIAQKFEFIMQDRAVPRDPTDADLRQWYDGHRAKYTLPPRRSFDQLYFAIDKRGEEAAHRLANTALAALRAGRKAPVGDDFPGQAVIRLLSQADTDRLFGGEDFAAKVFSEPVGQWRGPLRSGFGWHLVRLSEVQSPQPRDFTTARDDVLADWQTADRAARNEAAYADIRRRYRVVGLAEKP
jgi:hypothetical protein